jgi:hypothetical protein
MSRILLPNDFFTPEHAKDVHHIRTVTKGSDKDKSKEKPKSKKALKDEMEAEEAAALQALLDKDKLKRKEVEEYFRERC